MPAVPKRPTGFFTRVKQALTGEESESTSEHRRKLDAALKELNELLALGKISQEELDAHVAKLTRETNGQAR
jgi:hypothetical protein